MGIDAGSTTVKIAVSGEDGVLYSSYARHFADVGATLKAELEKLSSEFPGGEFSVCLTGSAGMGVAERGGFKFAQELIAEAEAARKMGGKRLTLIDIGGEDAKIIFFSGKGEPDIRMNGSCAGGTGAFIDQMASLMNMDAALMGRIAEDASRTYPIASRCGVFAKTDVQNLISRRVPLADVAASVFRAVAMQCASSLAKATDMIPPVLCVGGPLTFIPALRAAFAEVLNVPPEDMRLPEHSEVFAAAGASYMAGGGRAMGIGEIISRVSRPGPSESAGSLEPLFSSGEEFAKWDAARRMVPLPRREIRPGEALRVHMGIDSGSTTTKIVAIDSCANIVFSKYCQNSGNPLGRAKEGVDEFLELAKSRGASVEFASSAATGYGEDLLKAAFGMDFGIVETMAHLEAAKFVSGDVSFVLDIGGQDIKSIFVENGAVAGVELNESCSSGCGSFLQGFASMMNMTMEEFSNAACMARAPADLGTRCTVFMNSKVKEALRRQASPADIAAGLAVSVVKNCLFKVLKISNMDRLGGEIVVQGGAFRNRAVWRALEKLSGKVVWGTDSPELMGAFGAALYARASCAPSAASGFSPDVDASKISRRNLACGGCANRCSVVRFEFENGNVSHAGNKCERYFHSSSSAPARGENGVEERFRALFGGRGADAGLGEGGAVGIPRVLNMYENYPFWKAMFDGCGIRTVLSDESSTALAQSGVSWLMSDNICFPAKLVHGHILNLVSKGCRRIFYPMAVMEEAEGAGADNSFNCPVVSGYPNVVKNSMNLGGRFGVELDTPVVVFKSRGALRDTCWKYFSSLGVSKAVFASAFASALEARENFRRSVCARQRAILDGAVSSGRLALVFTGRPYHTDPLISQKAAEIAAGLGADAVADDAFAFDGAVALDGVNYVSQWTYPNRVVRAARAVAALPGNVVLVQLNSFGCGPDSFIMDEASEILKAAGKSLNVIRVDEISSPGSIRLRLRSIVESAARAAPGRPAEVREPYMGYDASYTDSDREKTVIVPWFSDLISPLVPAMGEAFGYRVENLPPPGPESVSEGLKYAHNEVCYPATVIVGDIVKFLKSAGPGAADRYVVGITQTGGQCRATNYLALIKNALKSAGFGGVKILSIGFGSPHRNSQPGFRIGKMKAARIALLCSLFSDAVSEMASAMRVREAVAGTADRIASDAVARAGALLKKCDARGLLSLLGEAVRDFNSMEILRRDVVEVGFIGEIYLKYNSFAHCGLAGWLEKMGVEAVRPPLRNFMMQSFVNMRVNAENRIADMGLAARLLSGAALKYVDSVVSAFDRVSEGFRFHRRHPSIFEMAKDASRMVSLVNQFGEGWLIAAEIAEFARRGIKRVVCVQPFGCIANHVVAKGIERRVKELYPDMAVLFLDIDSSTAPVNLQNRLHFLIGAGEDGSRGAVSGVS